MNYVLVIGEKPQQARALSERLGIAGVEAIPSARDWKLAVRCLTSHPISLVLLDVDLRPETVEFFRLIRDLTEVPIVARGDATSHEQQLWYLDNGAVEFVGRTVVPTILAAKVQSLLRNGWSRESGRGMIRVGELAIDVDSYSVVKGDTPISLTPIEFRLLRVLAENAGKACSRAELLKEVWGDDFRDCSHYLRLYIAYLRSKIEDNPRRPRMLLTEWGYGYRLVQAETKRESVRARRAVRAAASF